MSTVITTASPARHNDDMTVFEQMMIDYSLWVVVVLHTAGQVVGQDHKYKGRFV